MSTIQITTRTEGQCFACVGEVTKNGHVIHVTRPYPYGFNSNAYAAALDWATQHGYAPTAEMAIK